MNKHRLGRTLIVLLFGYLILTTTAALFDLWKAGDKLVDRKKTLARLEKDKQELLRKKSQVESREYLEKVARNELGMTKPGEKVYIIPKDLLEPIVRLAPEEIPTWQKWVRLITG